MAGFEAGESISRNQPPGASAFRFLRETFEIASTPVIIRPGSLSSNRKSREVARSPSKTSIILISPRTAKRNGPGARGPCYRIIRETPVTNLVPLSNNSSPTVSRRLQSCRRKSVPFWGSESLSYHFDLGSIGDLLCLFRN